MPVTSPVTMAKLCVEFGAPGDTLLSAFYRGGPYVPNTGTNAGVPTSGPMNLNQFVGAAAGPVALVQLFAISIHVNMNAGQAGFVLNVNGQAEAQDSMTGTTYPFTWLLSGGAGEYEVYATNHGSSGVVTGTFNSWVSLASTQAWGCRGSTRSSSHLNLGLQIRKIGQTEILASATMYLSTGIPV